MSKVMQALGLMSGTSLDGIDVSLVTTDGESHVVRGPAMTLPYTPEIRALLLAAIEDSKDIKDRRDRPAHLPHAERELTELHAAAVSHFLRKQGISRDQIDVIGFHGQTVLHRPMTQKFIGTTQPKTILDTPSVVPFLADGMITVQLGLGEKLADLTRIPVVYDMRAADVAAGGQGAPLVPVYHQAVTAKLPQRPVAVVNIGGVANVTWIGRDGRLLAFDSGPGNALIDDWMRAKVAFDFDADGEMAAQGKINSAVLHEYLNSAYFKSSPPKSLDRNSFSLDPVAALGAEDGAATLTAFTAETIARARQHMPEEPELWIISGGGRRNQTLMSMLAGLVHHAVVPAEAAGLNGDSLEAEAWGYLAVRCLKGLPITFPGTTGVLAPMRGGLLAKPKASIFATPKPANED